MGISKAFTMWCTATIGGGISGVIAVLSYQASEPILLGGRTVLLSPLGYAVGAVWGCLFGMLAGATVGLVIHGLRACPKTDVLGNWGIVYDMGL